MGTTNNDTVTEAPPSQEPKSLDRWSGVLGKVKQGITVSSRLETLRDMCSENFISPSDLTKIRECGGGAFATVEICKYKSSHGEAVVAVKRLRHNMLKNKEELANFVEECKLLRKLSNSRVTRYLGMGSVEGSEDEKLTQAVLDSTYLVQEYIDGGTLRDQVLKQMLTAHQRRKHYSQEQGLRWLIDIAKGLKYLHTSRPMARTLLLVVWRDGKLENVLMRKVKSAEAKGGVGLEAVLADFGLAALIPNPNATKDITLLRYSLKAGQPTGVARLDDLTSAVEGILHDQDEKVEQANAAEQAVELEADTPAQSLASNMSSMSALDSKQELPHSFDLTGKTGSFFYMAPEVANSEPYNEKADVFSYGCIMYEVMCGTIVSQLVVGPTGDELAATVYSAKVARGYRRPLPKFLSGRVRELIADCWAQDMTERPSMSQVLERLLSIQERIPGNSTNSGAVAKPPKSQQAPASGSAQDSTAAKPSKGCCGCTIS